MKTPLYERYLCRGKRVDDGEWVEGYYIHCPFHDDGYQDGIYVPPCTPDGSVMTFAVVPESVGQYTDLTDKNSKRIFEGDVHEFNGRCWVVRFGTFCDMDTGTNGYGWFLESKRECSAFDGNEEEYLNIIGNIHDNPKLIKDGTEFF